ncbi:hypothetical protein [Pseudomonas quasicaspiana]|uniref:hypothetical protein n=1 Tax=Pseudomonas quasicaspiana TaxID=2829821 RepID=UPI001E63AF0F|nr:hypothetical protein [Pseudomonas quasicaspiana]MCD5972321.1 hypothetical protein [Pseudomonas quasicaspiana]
MDTRMTNANTYYDLTKSVVINLQQTLCDQFIERDRYAATLSRQQNDIDLLEKGSDELREAAAATLSRQKLKLAATVRAIEVTNNTLNIIAGSFLQVARQAIEMRYGAKVGDCTQLGRLVSGALARDIIWQGRNQAMHYEDVDGGWSPLFLTLNQHHAGVFTPGNTSRAMAIIEVLGWLRFGQYEADMMDLGVYMPGSDS